MPGGVGLEVVGGGVRGVGKRTEYKVEFHLTQALC